MTKQQLKDILKPLIRNIVKEIILEEDNIVKHIIKECLSTSISNNKEIVFEVKNNKKNVNVDNKKILQERQEQDKEKRKKLLDAIGFDKSLNPFEGTKPLQENTMMNVGGHSVPSPLAGIDPHDSGVDVTKLLGGFRKFNIK